MLPLGSSSLRVGGRVLTQDGYFARILSVGDSGASLDLEVAGIGRRHNVPAASVQQTRPKKKDDALLDGASRTAGPVPAGVVSAPHFGGGGASRPSAARRQHEFDEARAVRRHLENDAVLGPWLGIIDCADSAGAVLTHGGSHGASSSPASRLVEFVDNVFRAAAAACVTRSSSSAHRGGCSAAINAADRGALVCGASGMGRTSILSVTARALSAAAGADETRRGWRGARVWWIDGGLLLRSFSVLGCLANVSSRAGALDEEKEAAGDGGAAAMAEALQHVQHTLWNFCNCVRSSGGEEAGGRIEVLAIDDLDELFQSRLRDSEGQDRPGLAGLHLMAILRPLLDETLRTRPWAMLATAASPDAVPQWARRKIGLSCLITLRVPPMPARAHALRALFDVAACAVAAPSSQCVEGLASMCHGLSLADLHHMIRFCFLSLAASCGRTEAQERPFDWVQTWKLALQDRRRAAGGGGGGVELSSEDQTGRDTDALSQVPCAPELQARLHQLVVDPIKRPDRLARLSVRPIRGLLLHGSSGSGKTFLARAAARECGCATLFVQAPRLLRPYLGESEAAVRQVFRDARTLAPCILILDQLDAIATQRSFASGDDAGASGVGARVLSTLLNEMDGVSAHGGHVLTIGCVRAASQLDSALLRPGRFDESLYVPPPTAPVRAQLLRHCLGPAPTAPTLDYSRVAGVTVGVSEAAGEGQGLWCSGGEPLSAADVCGVARDAALLALQAQAEVGERHLEEALTRLKEQRRCLRATLSAKLAGADAPTVLPDDACRSKDREIQSFLKDVGAAPIPR